MTDPVFIFCDGSHSSGTRIGAWGAVIRWRTYRWEIGGEMFANSANQTEAAAVTNALQAVPPSVPAIVFTDAQGLAIRHDKRPLRDGVHIVWKRARCDDHKAAHNIANRYRLALARRLYPEAHHGS
jgi:ribonuclease HI